MESCELLLAVWLILIGRLRFGHGLHRNTAFKNTKNTKTASHDDGVLELAPGMNQTILTRFAAGPYFALKRIINRRNKSMKMR